jgi:hypothetical protein
MPLRNRILEVILKMPTGDVKLDASINIRVRAQKAALAIQNKATIELIGLTSSLREQLLSQFTAFNQRQVTAGQASQKWIGVEVRAGWDGSTAADSQPAATVFIGDVVLCDPISAPPNIGVRITCFTKQIDRTSFVTSPAPDSTTFRSYVAWAAGQMGFGDKFICDTSFNDVVINNPARSIYVASALLIDIQDMYKPAVAAYIDDDTLIVKDRNKILNPSQIADLRDFIGTPTWTEWGAEFTVLFDQSVRLARGAKLTSKMNPGINGTYVILELDYDLTSRDTPFYVSASASPPST